MDSSTIVFKKPKNPLTVALEKMGQPIYRCQPPTGFKQTADFWVNPSGLINRIQLGLMLSSAKVEIVKSRSDDWMLSIANSTSLSNALREASFKLMQKPLNQAIEDKIYGELKSELPLMDSSKSQNQLKEAIPVEKIVGLILGSPDFQKR